MTLENEERDRHARRPSGSPPPAPPRARLRQASIPSIPSRIGPYRVLARLASGGMGEVYLARRVWTAGFERAVVIKRILPHLAADPEVNAAFLDEARLMATLRHPNIVSVLALSRDEGELYIVMEFLRGETLAGLRRELVGGRERLDPVLAIHIVSELCAGLHAAHELTDEAGPLNVVHRDVSPANVFVTFNGEVKILDFGIAAFEGRTQTLTQTGTAKGKVPYMAPEQFAGARLDRRTDVFAAGIVLHELVTGKRLFARESEAQVMTAILLDPIPLPSQIVDDGVLVPPGLDAICMRALARDPAERFPTADAMRGALRELMPTLDPRQRARDRLIELTRRVLPDRFAASQHLLRRASTESGDFTAISADAAGSISGSADALDACSPGAPESLPFVSLETSMPTVSARRAIVAPDRAWRITPRVALVGLVVAACASIAVGGTLPTPAPAPAAPQRIEVAPRDTHEIIAPRPTVTIDIEPVPRGALVSIDGVPRGTAPLHLVLARSEVPVEVTIAHRGYVTWRESLTPDVDRHLAPQLARARRSSARHGAGRARFYRIDDPTP